MSYSKKRILFLGEGELAGPARYLAAALRWKGISFDHRPDQSKIPAPWMKRSYAAVILSDYRAANFTPRASKWLARCVMEGTGFLMIGGWASFTGLVGGYSGHPVEKLLPVRCTPEDDRVNYPTGSLLRAPRPHALLQGLDWRRPPIVCGYHRVRLKAGTETVLNFHDVRIDSRGRPSLAPAKPALVLGRAGRGRTAAFLTDAAPHWAGGLVDWGRERVRIKVGPGIDVEVSDSYLKFFERLVRWVAG